MLGVASKAFFQTLSYSRPLKTLASRYGMSGPRAFARRFIAGETVEDAIAAVRHIQSQGLLCTLDYLGESVTTLAEADTATREYLNLIDAVDRAGVERNLSLKLTQLGLDVDRAMCVDNLRKILKAAEQCGFFVRIDMESSDYTDPTLEIFETVWKLGHRSVGVVLQSCLHRTEKDVRARERAGRTHQAGEGGVPRAEGDRLPAEVGRGCRVPAEREAPPDRRGLSRHRDAR